MRTPTAEEIEAAAHGTLREPAVELFQAVCATNLPREAAISAVIASESSEESTSYILALGIQIGMALAEAQELERMAAK